MFGQPAAQSQAYLCGVGKAFRLACSLLAPCLFVGGALGREHLRSGYKLRRAALRFGLMVFGVPLRSNTEHHQTSTTLQPSYAFALSTVPPRSLDRNKAVFGTAAQSQAYLCGVGKAFRLACSLLAPCLFVGGALGREHLRSGYKLRRAALRFGLMVFGVPLRSNTEHHQTSTTLQPSYAFALYCAPRSLDRNKAVFGTAAQSQAYLCGVGKAFRLACSLLAPCLFVGGALGREHLRSGYKLRRAALRFGLMVFGVPLRPTLNTIRPPLRCSPPTLSPSLLCPRSLDRNKAVFALLRRAKRICAV